MSKKSGEAGKVTGPFDQRFGLLVSSGQANEATVRATKIALVLVEAHYGIVLDEETGATLATHLATTMKRLQQGEVLFPLPDVVRQEISGFAAEVALAGEVAAALAQELNIPIPEDEVGFITVHLCTIRSKMGG